MNEAFTPPPDAFHYVGPGEQGSIKPHPDFNSKHIEAECKNFRKAFKGLGTDEYRIIRILSEHNNEQRQELRKSYKTCFGRDLVEDLKDEISGYFEELSFALLSDPRRYDAYCMKRAMKGAGTNEDWLIEILCCRNNEEMEQLKTNYKEMYKEDLVEQVEGETSGVFRKVLLSVLQGNRETSQVVDSDLVKKDARDIYDAGEGKLGTDEETFNLIFARRSFPHLREMFKEYKNNVAHKDIEDSIKDEFSFNAKEAFLAIAKYAKDPAMYMAERLYTALAGIADDKKSFIRLIVQRSEMDLGTVKQRFQERYGKSLEQFTREETSGDWGKLACRVISPTCNIR